MSSYRIGDHVYAKDDQALAPALVLAYAQKLRPACLCTALGAPMYIAKVGNHHVLKRMPNSGGQHSAVCDSYEPPPELSGLAQVMGSAIVEDPEAGVTALKLDFSLTRISGRASPGAASQEHDTVKSDGTKLTLRSVLHYLWDEAGFNRWAPGMAGKRSWFVIRKYLLQAAEGKQAKGANLAEILFVPEPFSVERREEIEQRRIARLAKAIAPASGARHLMIVIGELKEISQARIGYKVVFKHLPDYAFVLTDQLHRRLLKRFGQELEIAASLDDAHVVMVATFGLSHAGVATVDEVGLMVCTANWIPFESVYEKHLIETMTAAGRKFVKGLRFNLAPDRPLASLVASDSEPPVAMYVVPPDASEEFAAEMEQLKQDSSLGHWTWHAGAHEMPELPVRATMPQVSASLHPEETRS